MKSHDLGSSPAFSITRSMTLSQLQFPPLENKGVASDNRVVSGVQSFESDPISTFYSQVALDKSLHLSVSDNSQCEARRSQPMGICFPWPQVPHKWSLWRFYMAPPSSQAFWFHYSGEQWLWMVARRKWSGRVALPGGFRLSQEVYIPVLVPLLISWVTWTLNYSGTQFYHL